MHCECGVYIATTNHFCFLRSILTVKIWISLEQSQIDIMLDDEVFPFTYTSNPWLLAVITFLYGVLTPWRLSSVVGKELWSFVSLIPRKSTCVHTNSNKVSSLFLTELMLIYGRKTFFGCFSQECFKLFFVFSVSTFVLYQKIIGI